jgi:putative endonuclease
MKTYYVYILRCRDESYYTGVTNDLALRVAQHQQGIDLRCYTFRRRPLVLVYSSSFGDICEAIAWEKQLKGWSRKKKEVLIRREFDALPIFSRRYTPYNKGMSP